MFLSIVVPIYNERENLERLIPSLLDQSYRDFDIILVDDPKTSDGTDEYIKELKSDKIVYFLHEPGLRVPAKRNAGAAKSKGEFLYFIDADMEFPSGTLEQIVSDINSTDAEIVIVPERTPGSNLINRLKDFEKQLVAKNADLSAARIFTRQLFNQLGGYNINLDNGEDLEFSDRAIGTGRKLVFAECYVNHYETSGDSLVGYFRTKWNYGRKSAKYLKTDTSRVVSKGTLARFGYFKSRKLYTNPLMGVLFLIFKFLELAFVSFSFLFHKLVSRK
jgi:glycosyltransferase involved in cell wall biosynthesis